MKFLVFSDVHEDFDQIKILSDRAKEDDIDFVLVPGDFTSFERELKQVLKVFNEIGKPVYLLPGNHEESEAYKETVKKYKNLTDFDRSTFEKEDFIFLGYGGGGFSQTDAEFRTLARKWYGEHKNKKIIFVTHGPAYNTKLDVVHETHVGHKDYRAFIERIKPMLAICGHIHETAGMTDKIGDTHLINPCWEGMVIELN